MFYSSVGYEPRGNQGVPQPFWHTRIDSAKRNVNYLSVDNLHKMIKRFMVEKGMSKEELARVLEITVKNLEQLFSEEVPAGLLAKVNLPLVILYCSTKWD